jgi:lipid A 3-O-deacylase
MRRARLFLCLVGALLAPAFASAADSSPPSPSTASTTDSSATGTTSTAPAASPWVPTQVFVQYGSDGNTKSETLGLRWGWSWHAALWGGAVTGLTELSIANWRYDAYRGGSDSLQQLSISPMFQWRPDAGLSRWFLEGGIGLTQTSHRYITPEREFSTNFNFGSQIAVGVDLGERRQHELSLRAAHFSNGGIREPNPGQNFVQLRYGYSF